VKQTSNSVIVYLRREIDKLQAFDLEILDKCGHACVHSNLLVRKQNRVNFRLFIITANIVTNTESKNVWNNRSALLNI
jgi:hypothetical protein